MKKTQFVIGVWFWAVATSVPLRMCCFGGHGKDRTPQPSNVCGHTESRTAEVARSKGLHQPMLQKAMFPCCRNEAKAYICSHVHIIINWENPLSTAGQASKFSRYAVPQFPHSCNRCNHQGSDPTFRPANAVWCQDSHITQWMKNSHQFTVCPGVLLSKKHCSNPLESSKCFATSGTSQVELWRLNASVLAGVYCHEFPLFTCPGTVLFLVTPLVGLVLGYVLLSRSSRVESVRFWQFQNKFQEISDGFIYFNTLPGICF